MQMFVIFIDKDPFRCCSAKEDAVHVILYLPWDLEDKWGGTVLAQLVPVLTACGSHEPAVQYILPVFGFFSISYL